MASRPERNLPRRQVGARRPCRCGERRNNRRPGDVVPGFTLVTAGVGSLDELVSCAREREISALYALDGGSWVSHVVGAPALVNRAFSELFADGIGPGTPLIATSGRRG